MQLATATPLAIPAQAGYGHPGYRVRVLTRLLGAVEAARPKGCWLWTRGCGRDGYATVSFQGRIRPARWVAWVLLVGPAPSTAELVHTCHTARCLPGRACRHHRCINPRHLTRP